MSICIVCHIVSSFLCISIDLISKGESELTEQICDILLHL